MYPVLSPGDLATAGLVQEQVQHLLQNSNFCFENPDTVCFSWRCLEQSHIFLSRHLIKELIHTLALCMLWEHSLQAATCGESAPLESISLRSLTTFSQASLHLLLLQFVLCSRWSSGALTDIVCIQIVCALDQLKDSETQKTLLFKADIYGDV